MDKPFIDEKIQDLAYRTLGDTVRSILRKHRIETTKDLLSVSDKMLQDWNVPKCGIAAIDRILKKNNLKRKAVAEHTVALRILTRNSIIPSGSYAGRKVGELIDAKKYRALRRLYYLTANIDFIQEVKDAINIKRPIPKPGISEEAMALCDQDNEANIKGMAKLRLKQHISKEMREQKKAERRMFSRAFSKIRLQAANQGHVTLPNISVEENKKYNSRLFANFIIKHGYDETPIVNPARARKREQQQERDRRITEREQKWEWVAKARAYWKEIRHSIPDTFFAAGAREFLANYQFIQYVNTHYPADADNILPVTLYSDFLCPDYYELLESLELPYHKMSDILSQRERQMGSIIVTCAPDNEKVLLIKPTFQTNTDVTNQTYSLDIFNDDTFESVNIHKYLQDAVNASVPSFDEYRLLVQETSAISLKNIERMLANAVHSSNGELSTFIRRNTPGRQKTSFDLRIKEDTLFIREHVDCGREYLYTSFEKWAQEQASITELIEITERIKSSEII